MFEGVVCPTCGTEIERGDFMSISFILGGNICRHCLDEPSGRKDKARPYGWLCQF